MESVSVWNIALAIIAACGGGGVIILGLSGVIGKIWTNHLMQNDVHRHNREIEALKSSLQNETEGYRARLRKSDLVFEKEFQAANSLSFLIASLEVGYYDPWMEDALPLYYYMSGHRDAVGKSIGLYLSKNASVLPDDVRGWLTEARMWCVRAEDVDVPGGVDPMEAAEECYKLLKKSEDMMIKVVRDQSSA